MLLVSGPSIFISSFELLLIVSHARIYSIQVLEEVVVKRNFSRLHLPHRPVKFTRVQTRLISQVSLSILHQLKMSRFFWSLKFPRELRKLFQISFLLNTLAAKVCLICVASGIGSSYGQE